MDLVLNYNLLIVKYIIIVVAYVYINFGLDLQGGFEVLYQVEPLSEEEELTSEMLYSTYKSILKRIAKLLFFYFSSQ